jgi:hypothetical protein
MSKFTNAIRQRITAAHDWTISALGAVTESQLRAIEASSYSSGYHDGNDDPQSGDIAAGGFGYRQSATGRGLRDFTQSSIEEIQSGAWSQYQNSPMAKRIIELTTDYTVGGNVTITTEDTDLQEIFDAFWEDNEWDRRVEEFARQFIFFGEQMYPVFVRESDGRVRMAYTDPGDIDEVVFHPETSIRKVAVILKKRTQDKTPRIYRIVQADDDVVFRDPTTRELGISPAKYPGKLVTAENVGLSGLQQWELLMLAKHGLSGYTGSCIFDTMNSFSNQPRGWPLLMQLSDWVDIGEETLFNLAKQEKHKAKFVYNVKIEGDRTEVENTKKRLGNRPPENDDLIVTNQSETWEGLVADLKQQGTLDTARELQKYTIGGGAFPSHVYGDAADTNRSSAVEQNGPMFRSLESKQRAITRLYKFIYTFVRDQAEIAGIWRPTENISNEPVVNLPEVSIINVGELMSAAVDMTNSLVAAVDEGWITNETAATAYNKVMAEIDVNYDVQEELEKIDAEETEAAEDEQAARNGAFIMALNQAQDEEVGSE